MFKNLKNKKNEEKLLVDSQTIKEMTVKCDLLINMCDITRVKEAIRVLKDEIAYLKLSSKPEAKTLEKKISNKLDDLKLCMTKEEKAILAINDIKKMVKERDIIA